MKTFFKSLKHKLTFCILLFGLLPILFMHFVVINTYETSLIEKRTSEVRQRMTVLSASIGQTAKEGVLDLSTDHKDILSWYGEAYNGRLLLVDRYYRIVYDSFNADVGKYCVSDAIFSAFSGRDYDNYDKEAMTIDFVIPVTYSEKENKTIVATLVLSMSTGWLSEALQNITQVMGIVDAVLSVLVILLALLFSRRLMKPIAKAELQAKRIEEGNLATDIQKLRSYPEVDRIIETSAHVVAHYQELEETQEQFVSNVSHELRTPMASIRVLADSLIGQQNLPEEVYQEFLSDISTEIDRESRIIDDLLSMSRLDKGTNVMNFGTLSVNDLLLGVLKTVKPLAEKNNVNLVYESFRNVTADVDEVKMIQALSNLVENGIKYNHPGGEVRVSLDSDHEYFYIRISDTGSGIPEEALSRVFDRFYRVDKARSRETGGTGLGLPITKQIVVLHGGAIRVDSKENEGTTFTLRLPIKHGSEEM